MSKEKALSLIIKVIKDKLEQTVEVYEHFYIGKTDDIEERRDDPTHKGYNEMYELASGSPETISWLESETIKALKSFKQCKNKTDKSAGNENANILYVAFVMVFKGDKKEEIYTLFNDAMPIKDGFPIVIE